MTQELRIVLADDHELVRRGFRFVVERLGSEVRVREAESMESALEAAAAEPPDLIILDLTMPGMNGLEGIALVRWRHPKARIVILSGQLAREDVMGALNRGANGYLPKSMGAEAMIAALRLVLSGETFVPSLVMSRRTGDSAATGSEKGEPLTNREQGVLDLMCLGRSNKEIGRDLAIRGRQSRPMWAMC